MRLNSRRRFKKETILKNTLGLLKAESLGTTGFNVVKSAGFRNVIFEADSEILVK